MKIIVLAGGLSTERDVSLSSGASICRALRARGHKAFLLDVFMGLNYDPTRLEEVFDLPGAGLEIAEGIKTKEPNISAIKASREDKSDCFLGPNVIELCRLADISFLGLHGGFGEDGRLQATFDVLGIKYTGPSSIGNVLAMDKGVTKQIFKISGVPTPGGTNLYRTDTETSLKALGLSLPVVVKPCAGGSSIGVYIVQTDEEYKKALKESFEQIDEIIVEPYIKGREFTCGIIGEHPFPLVEIIPKSGFFDYANKYQEGCTEEICPARLSESLTKQIQDITLKAYHALKLNVYSRADFLLDDDNNIYCLEVNTLPGMTPGSLLPKEARAEGIEYGKLCEMIVEESLRTRP